MKTRILFIYFLSITFLTIWVYRNHFQTFYQQDEWLAVGFAIENGRDFLFKYPILQMLTGTGRIPGTAISILFLKLFPFQIWPFSLFAISMHILNSLLVFFIAYRVSKGLFIACIAGIFFTIASVSDQAVIWAGAITNVLPSTFFLLLSIFLYLRYISDKNNLLFWLSISSGIASYYFRESTMFIFIFLPLIALIMSKGRNRLKESIRILSSHWILGAFIIFVVVVRFVHLQSGYQEGHFVTNNANTSEKIFLHAVFYPLTSFSQAFIPPGQMFPMARQFEEIYYPYVSQTILSPAVYEFVISDMLAIIFSLLFIFFLAYIYMQKKKYRITIVFSGIFFVLSVLPYIILDKPNSYLESRYYYTSIFGAAVLLGVVSDFLLRSFIKPLKSTFFAYGVVVLFLSMFFLSQITYISKDIQSQIEIANERKNFLMSLQNKLPSLPDTSMLYFTGSQDYYTPGNKIPFQLGSGFIFMSFYYHTGQIPSALIREEFLSHLFAQGYREVDGKGFGYYRDFEKLRQDSDLYEMSLENIYAFSYDGGTKSLTNISEYVREDLYASREARLREQSL